MILHYLRMRRNVNRNVFNDLKNVSGPNVLTDNVSVVRLRESTSCCLTRGYSRFCDMLIIFKQLLSPLEFDLFMLSSICRCFLETQLCD